MCGSCWQCQCRDKWDYLVTTGTVCVYIYSLCIYYDRECFVLSCKGGWGGVVGGGWGVRPGRVMCGNTRFTVCLSRDSIKNVLFSLMQ